MLTSQAQAEISFSEAGKDRGASRPETLLRATLPLSAPGPVTGSILVLTSWIRGFTTPDLGGWTLAMMVGNLIQNQFALVRNRLIVLYDQSWMEIKAR